MREVKFRAWDEYYSRMYEVHTVDISIPPLLTVWPKDPYESIAIHQEHLMQYTGLKDKNGVEIYEGDVVKFIGWGYTGYVAFENCEFITKNNMDKDYALSPKDGTDFEVIGNIHEHPELLQEVK